MEVNHYSLVDLKAELSKRKSNLKSQKPLDKHDGYSYCKSIVKKPFLLSAKEIAANSEKSAERKKKINRLHNELAVEEQEMQRARKRLEEKAALYDQYKNGGVRDSVAKSVLLVDFDKKLEEVDPSIPSGSAEVSITNETEYGETSSALCSTSDPVTTKDSKSVNAELVSADMRRESERERWEESLLEASSSGSGLGNSEGAVHYQHALRDEKWEHGVGYFQFSKDESERAKQMELLKSIREQNEKQKLHAEEMKTKKETLVQSRLAKIRERRNITSKLKDTVELVDPVVQSIPLPEGRDPQDVERERVAVEQKKEAREQELKRLSHIRPWDKEKTRVLSQDEWVAKKRKERDANFAPPSCSYNY